MSPKKLVLFVEGDADEDAVPVLVKKILGDLNAWEHVLLHDSPFRVKSVENLTGRFQSNWERYLKAALKIPRLGGVLLLLDGDVEKVEGKAFCAAHVARLLSDRAKNAGAGRIFSFAAVFACMEYESWLIAGIDSLRGKPMPDGRPGVSRNAAQCPDDTEKAPRGAKQWLGEQMERGYRGTTDQKPLTELVSISAIRARNPRSFIRLENALRQLVEAIRTENHIPA